MAKINLLPWRERLLEERKRQFCVGLVGSVILALVLMIFVHITVGHQINSQIDRNEFLTHQISLLEIKIREIKTLEKTKAALLARMGIIQELQTNRTLVVHMFDELVNILPRGIHLTHIQRKGSTVTLLGKTESNANVSDLMRNIMKSKWLANPVLVDIKAVPDDPQPSNDFTLSLTLTNPYEQKEIK